MFKSLLTYMTVKNITIGGIILALLLGAGGYVYFFHGNNTPTAVVLPDNITLKQGVMCALVVNAPSSSSVLWLNFNDNLQTLQFDKGKTIVFLTNEKSKKYTVFAVVTNRGAIVQKKIDVTVGEEPGPNPPGPNPPGPLPTDPFFQAIKSGVDKDGKAKLVDYADTYKKFADKVVDDKTILTVGQLVFVLHGTMDQLIGKDALVNTRKNIEAELNKVFPTDTDTKLDDTLRAKYKEVFIKISDFAKQVNGL